MCFGCSKEPSHRGGSFEYPQHMFWLRNKKNNFSVHFYLEACYSQCKKCSLTTLDHATLVGSNLIEHSCGVIDTDYNTSYSTVTLFVMFLPYKGTKI